MNVTHYRFPFVFPRKLFLLIAGREKAKNLAGKCPPPDSDPFDGVESREDYASWSRQFGADANRPAFNSKNAVSFSSARTTLPS